MCIYIFVYCKVYIDVYFRFELKHQDSFAFFLFLPTPVKIFWPIVLPRSSVKVRSHDTLPSSVSFALLQTIKYYFLKSGFLYDVESHLTCEGGCVYIIFGLINFHICAKTSFQISQEIWNGVFKVIMN